MILSFLITSLVVGSVFGQVIPDYEDPYSPIFTDKSKYSWTDKVKMTIIAPSWNTDRHLIDSIGNTNDHPIKISTREHSLEPYRFTETDVNSGIFTGEIILTGFPHDANGDGDIDVTPRTTGNGPTNGFLEIDRDSAISISFEFAENVVLTHSVPVTWNLGKIQFHDENSLSDEIVIVRIVDPDMNLNPESIDHVILQVYSDSDIAGIEVNAIETSESSGMFTSQITLSSTLSSSGNRLYSIPGDQIVAKYDDFTLPKPYSINDKLEIQTSSQVTSSIPSTQLIENFPISFSDSFGNSLESLSAENQVQIVGTVKNDQNFKQQFVYLIQIRSSSNQIESISWITGELSANQVLDVSQSWIPTESGNYIIETFVWKSLNDTLPLSSPMSKNVLIE